MWRFLTIKRLSILLSALVLSSLPAAAARADHGRRLFLLTIGVSKLQNDPGHSLLWAAKDARDLARTFISQNKLLFDEVVQLTLTEEQASKNNIERALGRLRSLGIGQRDYVIVAAMGHGGTDPAGHYYFVPSDFDPQRGPDTVVYWTAFRTALASLPGMRLLILDTCRAGSAAGQGPSVVSVTSVQGNAPGTGLVTFAACLSVEGAGDGLLDMPSLQNGVFTYALIEALQGKADLNHDGVVTLAEAEAYVANRVQALTRGKQNPAMDRPASIPSNLPLARLGRPTSPLAAQPAPGLGGSQPLQPGTATTNPLPNFPGAANLGSGRY
jgi:uncharacterized caspase-like protein